MTHRGTFGFWIRSDGRLADNDSNLELLRKLFRDGSIIRNKFGPGNPGDFSFGSWPILSHLAGGSAVLELEDGRPGSASSTRDSRTSMKPPSFFKTRGPTTFSV